jgi:hypothetical protein
VTLQGTLGTEVGSLKRYVGMQLEMVVQLIMI